MGNILGKALLAATQPLKPLMPRMRPSLIIIGAQKAGTTTLFDLLSQHPRIIPPMEKEVSFFSRDWRFSEGLPSYWRRFPKQPVAPKRHITIDASPGYMYAAPAAERIARYLPEALCIAVLRDPVSRAYSAWNMYRQFKDDPDRHELYDPREFEQAVEEELAGMEDIRARRYLANSTYAPQLKRYLEHVGRDRLVLYGFKQLAQDAPGLVNDLLARVSLPPLSADHPAFSVWSNKRVYPAPLDPALTARLRDWFSPDQQALRSLFDDVPDYLESV